MGLQLVAKKMKKLPNEQAIYILESVSNSVQYLLKHNYNEYIIEGIRKIVDIIIEDEPSDKSMFLMEKKAEFIRLMITKIGELQGLQDRKDNPQTIMLIEAIYE